MQKTFELGSARITPEIIFAVAHRKTTVTFGKKSREAVEKSHAFLLNELKSGKTHYGVNTGFGLLSNVKIAPQDLVQLQLNIIRSHSAGLGEPIAPELARAMVFLRAADLSQGFSGVSAALIERLILILNSGAVPCIPEQGSVGASGDLAPLAHLALLLIGEGFAYNDGKKITGAELNSKLGVKILPIGPKEGLALINGTQFMSAHAALNLIHSEHLLDLADVVGAMTVEALRGTDAAFEPEIHEVKPHPGQALVAERIRGFLKSDGAKSGIAQSHKDCGKVQDPYSLRCMPQVHGASREAIAFVRQTIEREINSVTDNPLVFADREKIISGGNFHGQYLAMAMDLLAIAMAEMASISEQRVAKLVNPALSDLPAFLAKNGGLNSGLMIVHYAAASIVSENKTLCHPAVVDSIPTSADKEDHVSMGAWGARKAMRVVNNVRRVLAIEILAATQGIEFLRPLKSSRKLEKFHATVRAKVPAIEQDRIFANDLETLEKMIREFEFQEMIS